jgi:hypothetical protein
MTAVYGLIVATVIAHLIDNIAIDVIDERFLPDRGLILDEPSRLGTLR